MTLNTDTTESEPTPREIDRAIRLADPTLMIVTDGTVSTEDAVLIAQMEAEHLLRRI